MDTDEQKPKCTRRAPRPAPLLAVPPPPPSTVSPSCPTPSIDALPSSTASSKSPPLTPPSSMSPLTTRQSRTIGSRTRCTKAGKCGRCGQSLPAKSLYRTCSNCRSYWKTLRLKRAAARRCSKCGTTTSETPLRSKCHRCSQRDIVQHARRRLTEHWRRVVEALADHGHGGSGRGMCKDAALVSLAKKISAGRSLRCAICGIPHWVVSRSKILPARRLSLDRINPEARKGGLRNLRLLCPICNSKRGAGLSPDNTVWRYARWWWTRALGDRTAGLLFKTPPSTRKARSPLSVRWRIT